MNEKDKIIQKIRILMEDSSTAQLKYLEEAIKIVVYSEKWKKLHEPQSRNFTNNGLNGYGKEDAEEGNFGSLYRSE